MKDDARRIAARARAEVYAPRPTDSRIVYALISVSILLIGLVAIGGFYDLNFWRHPLLLALLVFVALAVGLLFRRRQSRRHKQAHRDEYDSEPTAPPA